MEKDGRGAPSVVGRCRAHDKRTLSGGTGGGVVLGMET
jgi:hypothetical protein